MASRTSTPRTRSPSTSSDSSDTTMLDAPTHVALTPARPRQPSMTQAPSTAQAASAADPSFSLLLSLPRELRDRIYTYALTSPYPFWWPGQAPMKHHVSVNLLRANTQIYNEAVPVLYTENKFLFTHPSDCNVFRVVASPHAEGIQSVYFRVREKDLRLWTAYLGSKSADRSLKADLPALKNLWIFMRCATGTGRILASLGVQGLPGAHAFGGVGALPPGGMGAGAGMVQHIHQHVQQTLGHQVATLQQQVQHLTHAVVGATPANHAPADAGHHVPPPPPPPPPQPSQAPPFASFAANATPIPHHHPQPPAPAASTQGNHHILTNFLRFERELGIESLCLSLRETLADADRVFATHTAGAGGHREWRRGEREREAGGRAEPGLGHREARAAERARDRRGERVDDAGAGEAADATGAAAGAGRDRAGTPSSSSQGQSALDSRAKERTKPGRRSPPDVKIVCIMRLPKPEVSRLVRMYPDELNVDRNGDARTRFRRLHGAEVCVEISGFEGVVG
ncbi:hypothetical protein B5807_06750 [Epicoccum nigrum]|jgi:hypothetical protein|uniref:F-box domain-containing protein n=1 Tax=Epicoccum nigrum TaxID=105696 RepID=A0A1Y2LZ82_EPING|nr:hypothetical protein B5807_06750 [Epicoccum nigrum]